jgi:hypothetical protein
MTEVVASSIQNAEPPIRLENSLGGMVDQLYELNDKKRALEEELSLIDIKRKYVEIAIINDMEKQNSLKVGGLKATASISTSIVPNVIDWESFFKYISRKKYWHLVERRPSVTGCRELFETKGAIPGVVPFTKIRLSVRKA